MANIMNGHLKSPFQKFSVETVRNLLETDNKGIAKLCAQVSLMPKKDDLGRTYFTKDDLEILRRVKSMNKEIAKTTEEKIQFSQKSYATTPVKNAVSQKLPAKVTQTKENFAKELPIQHNFVQQPTFPPMVGMPIQNTSTIEKLATSLTQMQDNLTEKMSALIEQKLDEKLDGMDEVVVELVRCKTENETLRYKMNELNKELYNLKNELNRYKSVGMGFYIKKGSDQSNIL